MPIQKHGHDGLHNLENPRSISHFSNFQDDSNGIVAWWVPHQRRIDGNLLPCLWRKEAEQNSSRLCDPFEVLVISLYTQVQWKWCTKNSRAPNGFQEKQWMRRPSDAKSRVWNLRCKHHPRAISSLHSSRIWSLRREKFGWRGTHSEEWCTRPRSPRNTARLKLKCPRAPRPAGGCLVLQEINLRN